MNNDKNAPVDLKQKAILIAAALLELANKTPINQGTKLATCLLESGATLKKFLAICEAQGGFHEPQAAAYTYDIVATHKGIVSKIDNRNLAMVAKFAGAPNDPTAGIEYFAKLGTTVEKGQLLYRIHAEHKGELEYALAYTKIIPNIVKITREE